MWDQTWNLLWDSYNLLKRPYNYPISSWCQIKANKNVLWIRIILWLNKSTLFNDVFIFNLYCSDDYRYFSSILGQHNHSGKIALEEPCVTWSQVLSQRTPQLELGQEMCLSISRHKLRRPNYSLKALWKFDWVWNSRLKTFLGFLTKKNVLPQLVKHGMG